MVSRLVSFLKVLVVSAVVMASLGAAVWALSVLNARTYTLEQRDRHLWVLKGRLLPHGFEPYTPDDPSLVDAYAPIDLRGQSASAVTDRRYDDRDALDRALFTVLEPLAKTRVTSDLPEALEEGLTYVRRAERLTGLSSDQRDALGRLQTDAAFYLARIKLEDAQRQVDEALRQLRLAAKTGSRHARQASQMLLAVEPPSKAMSDALRGAVHELSTPPLPAPAEPAP